jgi:sortase A
MNKRKRTWSMYGAVVCMFIGLGMALWNGYCYWSGYHAVKHVGRENKNPVSLQAGVSQRVVLAAKPKIGEQIGELFIPKLSISVPIYHGTAEEQLRKGIGHYLKKRHAGRTAQYDIVGTSRYRISAARANRHWRRINGGNGKQTIYLSRQKSAYCRCQ